MSRRFVVSTAVLDGVDFIAAAIIASLDRNVVAIVDGADGRTQGPAARFDPRLAVPLAAKYDHSPDRSVRQQVAVPSALMTERFPFRPLELARLLEIASQPVQLSGDDSAEAATEFMRKCFSALGLTHVQVQARKSRLLPTAARSLVLQRLTAFRHPSGPYQFRQAGYVLVDGRRYDSVAPADDQGTAYLLGRGLSPLAIGEASDASVFELHGPLDALSLPTIRGDTVGHAPWFLEVGKASPELVPAIEVVRSLFLKNPNNRSWNFASPSGVLIDEYPSVALTRLRGAGVFAPSWLFEAVRWLALVGSKTDERWAWSQSSVYSLVHALRHGREMGPDVDELRFLLAPARESDALAKDFHTKGRSADSNELVSAVHRSLGRSIQLLAELLSDMGLPATFTVPKSEGLDGIRRVWNTALAHGDDSRSLSDIRHAAWSVVHLGLCGIMLYGDTTLRASIPLLAQILTAAELREYVESYRQEFEGRIENLVGLRCI